MQRVLGLGIDIVETDRIRRSIERFGERFLDRVFLPAEKEYAAGMQEPGLHFAARFAAKEAVSKALGTGIGEHCDWRDIEVMRGPRGEPCIILHGAARLFAQEAGITKILVSLSHTRDYAAANALLLADG